MYTIGILPVYEACLAQQLPWISPDAREGEREGPRKEQPPPLGTTETGWRWIWDEPKLEPTIRGKVLMRDPPLEAL
ncbi:hypothetical protein JOD24_001318 [Kroppenstedtia sanguinis]|uniref:Uncharacterized protein n=1 Tax=Kroppenstedtia sanguinis TaxID=1380684 RepID=A0ABW4CB45_9BACL